MLCYCCWKGYLNKMLSASLIQEPHSNWKCSKYSLNAVRDVDGCWRPWNKLRTTAWARSFTTTLSFSILLTFSLHPVCQPLRLTRIQNMTSQRATVGRPNKTPHLMLTVWSFRIFPKVDNGLYVSVGTAPLWSSYITCERWRPAGPHHITNADILCSTGAQRWQRCAFISPLLRTPKRRWPRRDQRLDEPRGFLQTAADQVPLLGPEPWRNGRVPTRLFVAVFMRVCPDHHCMYWSPSIWHFIHVFIHLTSKVGTIRKESECDFFTELLSPICGCQPLQNGSFGSFF